MDDWLGLTGKRALVVGAGAFGTACSRELLRAGAAVHLADVDARRLADVAAELDAAALSTGVCDVTDAGACEALVADAAGRLGRVDVLLHAVGINDRRAVLDMEVARWREILEVNLTSAFAIGRAAGARMCAQGAGRVVFFSSVSSRLAHPHHAPYAASKGGLDQLARVMAVEWAPHGVTVNAVAPAYTESDLTAAYLARPGVREHLVSRVPAGRLGTVEDVVGPVLFLCSERSAFVTGQVLYVDGGRTLD